MLENWIFMTGFLGFSLMGLFHGCVLLFAPDRYIPSHNWGRSNLRLARKPPFEFGKRFGGLILSAAIVGIFMRPAILWMMHPVASEISGGESPLPRGVARWDLLGITTIALLCGFLLLTRPEQSVGLLFAADKTKLAARQDHASSLDTLHTDGRYIDHDVVIAPCGRVY
ncbi:MAG TPA: hypothetical protein VG322_11900 [Candidatus Acidoferrales bacterium]|jgi:hypothetical protein|nr:hypothetical protein [Candidatus Acidoferrales bacterium]